MDSTKRQAILAAAETRRRGSVPPKVTRLDEAQDPRAFVDLVNKIRGKKPAPEALQILSQIMRIASHARHCYHERQAKGRPRASKIQGILQCEPANELFLKLGFRRQVDEMLELYSIPGLAGRPSVALALLDTGIEVLESEIEYLKAEEQIRKERAERERLADKAAREVVRDKILNDRRLVAARGNVPATPRFKDYSGTLGDS